MGIDTIIIGHPEHVQLLTHIYRKKINKISSQRGLDLYVKTSPKTTFQIYNEFTKKSVQKFDCVLRLRASDMGV